MRESSFELASRLRAQAEALEELFLEGEKAHSFQSRLDEEDRLEDLLSLAQDRLASLRLEALQEALEDVDAILRGLREDESRRSEEGRSVALVQSFISIAEAERARLHAIINAAVRAEEESRKARQRLRAKARPSEDKRARQGRELSKKEAQQRRLKVKGKAVKREVVDSA